MDFNAAFITHRDSKKLLQVADTLRRRGVTVVHPKERPTTVLALSRQTGKAAAKRVWRDFFDKTGLSHLAFAQHKPTTDAYTQHFYAVSRRLFGEHPCASTYSLKRNSIAKILKDLGQN